MCDIGRATTDASVMNVFEKARRASLSNVGIICTRSDVSHAIKKIIYVLAEGVFRIFRQKKRKETGARKEVIEFNGSLTP